MNASASSVPPGNQRLQDVLVPAGEPIRTPGDDSTYTIVDGLAYAHIGDRFLGVLTAGDVVGPDSPIKATREAEITARTDIWLRGVRPPSEDGARDGLIR